VAAQVAHLPDEVAERVAGWQADSVLTAAVATDTANVIAVVAAMVTAIIALLAVGAVVWFFALARKGVARDEAARQRERGEDEAARRAEREADATVRATEIAAEREARAELRRAHAAIADAVKQIAENRTVTGRELFGVIDPEGAEKLRWVLELGSGSTFVLRNQGPGAVHGVAMDVNPLSGGLVSYIPEGELDLEDGEGHRIVMRATSGLPIPAQVWVTTREQPERLAVPVPE
jgi:hypothetical protein